MKSLRLLLTSLVVSLGLASAHAESLITDIITFADITDPSNPYSDPYDIDTKPSGAKYQLKGRVQSSGGHTYMVWDDASGLCVTSTADGAVRSLTVTFEPGQTRPDERQIYIYTSPEVYTGVTDAYSPTLQGTLIATRTAENDGFEFCFTEPARAFALTHGDLALRIASISVVWDTDAVTPSAQCTAPEISPADGSSVIGSMKLTISAVHPSHSIYYTTDGSTPSASSGTLYTSPLFIEDLPGYGATTTIRAIATAPGMYDSDIAEARYTAFPEVESRSFGLVTDTQQLADGDRLILVAAMPSEAAAPRKYYAFTTEGYPRPFGEQLAESDTESDGQHERIAVKSSAVDIFTLRASGSTDAPWMLESTDGSILWTDGSTQSICRGEASDERTHAKITINITTSHAEIIFVADPSHDNAIRFEPESRRFLASDYQGGYVVRPFIYKYGLSSIDTIPSGSSDSVPGVYTLQGVRLSSTDNLPSGTYIICRPGMTASKIFVR